eukprot:CAMPEP_0203703656 /NCGR_PEP_ID=MMETSP0091-20130426/43947_1 /ASSEMBLY_ACC=CAM_ASM_001089 /TAXON_ID=426623 /ORGANISM="Chaetoceros affinis, Strain CCMP159" /LENGTH=179 /DNA_ID=CAMNT_0050578405 /DNA_START=30 /DNA_END=566 /DNA_ORIENTATION=+
MPLGYPKMRTNAFDSSKAEISHSVIEADSFSYYKSKASSQNISSSRSRTSSRDFNRPSVVGESEDCESSTIKSISSSDTNSTSMSSCGSNDTSSEKGGNGKDKDKDEEKNVMKSNRSFLACGLCMVMNATLSFFIVEKRRLWTVGHALPMICDVAEFGFLVSVFLSFTGSIMANYNRDW